MKFEKDGVVYEVKDPVHIDCFRAKGWTEVPETEKETKKTTTKK